MKSVRLSPELEAKLRQAARMADLTESELIRAAIADKCDAILRDRADVRLADIIGIADLGGGVANDTGRAFTELLVRREEERRRAAAERRTTVK